MQCPKCGSQNPEDAKICQSCSFTFTSSDIKQSQQKRKKTIFHFVSFALIVLSFILIFLKPVSAFIVAILALCSEIAAIPDILRKYNKQKKNRISNYIAVVVLIFSSFFVVILTYFCIDAAPITNDYTIKDLKSAAPKYSETFYILNNLSDERHQNEGHAIGFSKEDIEKIEEIKSIFELDELQSISKKLLEYEEDILLLWKKSQKGRDILTKLNSFPEIADLTKPSFEIDIPYVANIRRLAYVYHSYICLQSIKGDHETAINELIVFDLLFKNISIYSHKITIKMLCIACFNLDIKTANFIINNPQTPDESLLALKRYVILLSDEQTSLRNSLMFEYLSYKNEIIKMSKTKALRRKSITPLKLNSSLRLYRNIIDKWIADEENRTPPKEMRVWPLLYPDLPVRIDKEGKLPGYYKVYNAVGFLLIEMLKPALERVIVIKKNLQVHADLLRIVLNKRLGEEVSLKALAYNDEYIVDVEKGLIFSPGPDGLNGTKDDIKLSINPEVLGWEN